DTFVDAATYVIVFAGVMVGWWRQGMGPWGIALAAAVTIALPATLIWSMRFVRAATGDRVDTKLIEYGVVGAARATGAPALRLASAIFVLFRREAVSLAFFLAALVTSQRVVYPALVAGGLIIVAATIVVYRDEIDQAIRVRVNRPAA